MSEHEQDHAIEIRSRDDLEAFLVGQPTNASIAITVRAALRVLPFAADVEASGLRARLTLSMFRATLAAQRGHSAVSAAADAVSAADAAVFASASAADAAVFASAAASAASAASAAAYAAYASASAASASADAASAVHPGGSNDSWVQVSLDGTLIQKSGSEQLQKSLLWQEQPSWFISRHAKFKLILLEQGGSWPLLETWYDQIVQNASIDPFPIQALDEIANESPEFWGDGDDNPRTPDIVMNDIAKRLGWSAEPKISEDSRFEPSFIPSEPIAPDRDKPQPLIPRDHDYYHKAAQKRLDRLKNAIEEEGPSGEQVLSTLTETIPDIDDALGSTPLDSFMTALVAEDRTLSGLLTTQDEIAALPEHQREFEAPLWPKHVKEVAQDLHNILLDLIENDKKAREIVDAPGDGEITPESEDFVRRARKAIEQLAENTELFAPETLDLLYRYLAHAEAAVRKGGRVIGRPILGLRGLLGNLANALARGTKWAWEKGGAFAGKTVVGTAAGAAYLTSIKTVTVSLEALSSVIGTQRLDSIIAILRSIGGAL